MTTSEIRNISLSSLHESPTNPRTSWGDMAGLEASMRQQGFRAEHPLLVRPSNDNGFEIVTGHRRARAARAVGITEVPCVVDVELGDVDAIELQLIENAQRADVHPLDEGEAYRRLRDEHHQSIAHIARRVGKSETAVSRRLSLTRLVERGRTALIEDAITLDVAFELSRLPRDPMQEKALEEILRPRTQYEQELSAKKIIERIREKYFLRLASARWDLNDEQLVPSAGACTTCSKRSGSQPALFADLVTEDTCTDSECHAQKSSAAKELRIATWKSLGAALLPAEKAKGLFNTWGDVPSLMYGCEHIDLDAVCHEDPDRGEWWSLIAPHPEGAPALDPLAVVIAIDPRGNARELAKASAAQAALRIAGYSWAAKAAQELEAENSTGKRKSSEKQGEGKAKASKSPQAQKWEDERATARRIENFILERVAEKASRLTDEQLLRAAFMANAPLSSGIAERRGMKNATEDSLRKLGVAAKGPTLRVLVAESLACLELDLASSEFEVDDNSEIFKRLALDPKKLAAEVRAAIADEKSGKGPGSKVDKAIEKPNKTASKAKGKAKPNAKASKPAAKASPKAKANAKKGGAR